MKQSKALRKLKQAIYTKKKGTADRMLSQHPKLLWRLSVADKMRYCEL